MHNNREKDHGAKRERKRMKRRHAERRTQRKGATRDTPIAVHTLNPLQPTATHCNPLQPTATHCNTLQHTATQETHP